jgi:hypothetical integral membrane protein (TIGR02206 family)
MPVRFEPFSASHFGALLFTAFLTIVLIASTRSVTSENIQRFIKIFLAVMIGGGLVSKIIESRLRGSAMYPMQLCDWAAIAIVVFLFSKNILLFECAYFWGFAGTLQAMITPDIRYDFPHANYFLFFIMHSGIIIAVFYSVFGLQMKPRPFSVIRIFLVSQIYLCTAMIVNHIFNKNYGYLSSKPGSATMLDYLGDWPWYIFSLEAVALLLFALLYLPFYIGNRKKSADSV